MFSIKPRLKKDISERFFGLGLHFSVSAFGLDLKKWPWPQNPFLDVLFQPWFNWKNILFTLAPFFLTLFYNNFDNKILFLCIVEILSILKGFFMNRTSLSFQTAFWGKFSEANVTIEKLCSFVNWWNMLFQNIFV